MIGNKVEAAYQRGDLLERRRRLMADWSTFLSREMTAGEVVAFTPPDSLKGRRDRERAPAAPFDPIAGRRSMTDQRHDTPDVAASARGY